MPPFHRCGVPCFMACKKYRFCSEHTRSSTKNTNQSDSSVKKTTRRPDAALTPKKCSQPSRKKNRKTSSCLCKHISKIHSSYTLLHGTPRWQHVLLFPLQISLYTNISTWTRCYQNCALSVLHINTSTLSMHYSILIQQKHCWQWRTWYWYRVDSSWHQSQKQKSCQNAQHRRKSFVKEIQIISVGFIQKYENDTHLLIRERHKKRVSPNEEKNMYKLRWTPPFSACLLRRKLTVETCYPFTKSNRNLMRKRYDDINGGKSTLFTTESFSDNTLVRDSLTKWKASFGTEAIQSHPFLMCRPMPTGLYLTWNLD